MGLYAGELGDGVRLVDRQLFISLRTFSIGKMNCSSESMQPLGLPPLREKEKAVGDGEEGKER